MKNISAFLLLFVFACIHAQNISDYRYVFIPKKFADFKNENQYNLTSIMGKVLTSKKYIVITEMESLKSVSSCDVLYPEVVNKSNMFKNKIQVEFKDCNGKIVSTIPASSEYKELDKGFQDALQTALRSVGASNPKTEIIDIKNTDFGKESDAKSTPDLSENTVLYKNGNQVFKRVNLQFGQFNLVDAQTGALYAAFNRSFKKDVYRVKLPNGVSTIGFEESGLLFLENVLEDGTVKLEQFTPQK